MVVIPTRWGDERRALLRAIASALTINTHKSQEKMEAFDGEVMTKAVQWRIEAVQGMNLGTSIK